MCIGSSMVAEKVVHVDAMRSIERRISASVAASARFIERNAHGM
jgi:hypothetical protein